MSCRVSTKIPPGFFYHAEILVLHGTAAFLIEFCLESKPLVSWCLKKSVPNQLIYASAILKWLFYTSKVGNRIGPPFKIGGLSQVEFISHLIFNAESSFPASPRHFSDFVGRSWREKRDAKRLFWSSFGHPPGPRSPWTMGIWLSLPTVGEVAIIGNVAGPAFG